jgi:cytosine/adenosine deaminase-related metal-dependent hydrolase
MKSFRAAWVCPIERPPIRDGIVDVDGGRVIAIREPGTGNRPGSSGSRIPDPGSQDLGNVAILPGLINAHTHLELSWLRGRVPPATCFTDWVKTLVAIRRGTEQLVTPDIVAPIRDAIREVRASGTIAVGDITNSLAAVEPMKDAELTGVVFHEFLGFKERDGALIDASRGQRAAAARHGIRISLAPHAPYSTSVELLTHRSVRS